MTTQKAVAAVAVLSAGLSLGVLFLTSGKLAAQEVASDDAAAIKRADQVRLQIVESLGTPNELAITRSGGRNYFGLAFARYLTNMGGPGMTAVSQTNVSSAVKSNVLSVLRQIVSRVSPQGTPNIVPETADSNTNAKQDELLAAGGVALSQSLVTTILGEDQGTIFSNYGDNYLAKASMVFKAASVLLENQAMPSPFVLYLCDSGSAREVMSTLRPGDNRYREPVWDLYTQPQQWQVVASGLKEFFSEGSEALTNPQRTADFFGRLPNIGGNDEETIRVGYGNPGVAKYNEFRRMNPSLASQMLLAASATRTGNASLYGILPGDLKPGVTLPITK